MEITKMGMMMMMAKGRMLTEERGRGENLNLGTAPDQQPENNNVLIFPAKKKKEKLLQVAVTFVSLAVGSQGID